MAELCCSWERVYDLSNLSPPLSIRWSCLPSTDDGVSASFPAIHSCLYTYAMSPSAVEETIPINSKSQTREPLKLSGALKDVEHFDVTPAIGREFPKANLVDWLNAPNSDELVRDLAITSKLTTHSSHTEN